MTNPAEDLVRKKYEVDGWKVYHEGAPDFLLVKTNSDGKIIEAAFREVKRAGKDDLSHAQLVWRDVLLNLLNADYQTSWVDEGPNLYETEK